MTLKVCSSCKEEKTLDSFWNNHKGAQGKCAKCIPCATLTPLQKWRSHLKSRYNLTIEEWNIMLIAQAGRCSICNKPMDDPVVDHCHKGGDVRELLCRFCNIALGAIRDDLDTAKKLVLYLERH